MRVLCSTVDEAENNLKNIKEEEGRSTGILINWTGEKHTHKHRWSICSSYYKAHRPLKSHKYYYK